MNSRRPVKKSGLQLYGEKEVHAAMMHMVVVSQRTFIHQLFHRLPHAGALLFPPAVKECHLHVDEPAIWVFQQLIHHRVQDVLHPRMLDVIAIWSQQFEQQSAFTRNLFVCTHVHKIRAVCSNVYSAASLDKMNGLSCV